MDPGDPKVKVDWFYLKQLALSTVRGGQLLYILLGIGYKYSSNCHSVSFLIFSIPFS